MEGAVVHAHLDPHHRIARHRAVLHALDHTLLNRGDEVAGDGAADGLVDEPILVTILKLLHGEVHLAVLAAAARLLLVLVMAVALARHSLAVGYFRRVQLDAHVAHLLHHVHHHVQMHVAQPLDNGFARLRIALRTQRLVLLKQTLKSRPEFVVVSLRLRGHRSEHDRLRELDGTHPQRIADGAERVAHLCRLQFGNRDYVASGHRIHIGVFLAARHKQRGDLLAPRTGVLHLRVDLEGSGKHPHVAHLPDEAV